MSMPVRMSLASFREFTANMKQNEREPARQCARPGEAPLVGRGSGTGGDQCYGSRMEGSASDSRKSFHVCHGAKVYRRGRLATTVTTEKVRASRARSTGAMGQDGSRPR